jgi:hypothetical protein
MSFSVPDIEALMKGLKSSASSAVVSVQTNKWGKPIKTQPSTKSVQQVKQTATQSNPKSLVKTPQKSASNFSQRKITSWEQILQPGTARRAAMCLPNRGPPMATQQQVTSQPPSVRPRSMSVVSDLIDLRSDNGRTRAMSIVSDLIDWLKNCLCDIYFDL